MGALLRIVTMNKIKCPHCNQELELTEALTHQLKEQLLLENKDQQQKELEEAKLEAAKKAEEKFELMLKTLQDESRENKQRNRELQDQLVELTKQLRAALEEKENAKLEIEKRLLEEGSKIRAKAQEEILEQQKLKDKEKDLKIEGLMKALDDAQRKASQGSQQTQGEALESEFENLLRQEFPNDKISEVKKGIRGADIQQEVWDSRGQNCGIILWEFKNTSTWSEGWIDKLKEDKRAIKASEAVLITEVLPKEIKTAGWRKGIWVATRGHALILALTMRANLIQLTQIKMSQEGKNGKMEDMWNYLSGNEFRNRMETIIEAFSSMQEEVETEKRYFSKKWARDEKNIRRVIDSTHGMQGELESIMHESLNNGEKLKLPSSEAEEIA